MPSEFIKGLVTEIRQFVLPHDDTSVKPRFTGHDRKLNNHVYLRPVVDKYGFNRQPFNKF